LTSTKVTLLQTAAFPAVLYEGKSWAWNWRRLLRIPWTVRRINASVINQIKPKHSLETLARMSKLKYSKYTVCKSDSIEKNLMLGMTDDSGKRGRQ
jgi:hypothetical protein